MRRATYCDVCHALRVPSLPVGTSKGLAIHSPESCVDDL